MSAASVAIMSSEDESQQQLSLRLSRRDQGGQVDEQPESAS